MIESKDELINLIKSYEPNKIVFWIGSGIDNNSPTNLPTANDLTKNLLELTCGKEYSTKILQQCKLIYKNIPRMEAVISDIKLFEKELSVDCTVVSGFQSFLEAPPNNCHQILAQFLNKGANIVSFNYGNQISKAFNLQYSNKFPEEPVFDIELDMYLYSNEKITTGKIYYPHGVANHLNTIGISLNEVKKTFSSKFKKILSDWIENGYCFIFLGYSCSDDLDVNPFFINFKTEKKSNSIGIIINHSTENEFFSNKNQNYKISDILTPFNKYVIFNTVTFNFLKEICIHDFCNISEIENDKFIWLCNFKAHCKKYNEELYQYISIGIIKSLGLNYKNVLPSNWYKQKNYKLFKRNWYIDYYYFICLSQSLSFLKLIKFAKNLYKDNLSKSDIYSKLFLIKKAAKVTLSPSKVYCLLNSNENNWIESDYKIDWNISTALNRNAEWIIIDILKNPFFFKIKQKKHSEMADFIMKSNDIIINLGNDSVFDFYQQLTALRYNGILLMLFENKYELSLLNLNKALRYYYSIYSIDGIIRCKLYLAFVEIINFKINKTKGSLKNAKKILDNIYEQYKAVMNYKNKYLYMCIKIYFILHYRPCF